MPRIPSETLRVSRGYICAPSRATWWRYEADGEPASDRRVE
jgi:hypothetical protein